ncbi:hypothetical protein [Halolamina salina]|uniref:PGF-CTERM protein n=1 Tax=Halolamina salina TaxID=1220023 RepID=A0ABD6B8Z2_9EURY
MALIDAGGSSEPLVDAGGGSSTTSDSDDSGSSSDSYEFDQDEHEQTLAQGDLINDARANVAGHDQDIEVDGAGEDADGVEVTDQNGGLSDGGTTVIDPDTSEDSTGDRVGLVGGSEDTDNDGEEEETTTVVQEDGSSTTVTNAPEDSANDSPNNTPAGSDNSGDAEGIGRAGKAGAALLIGALVMGGR